MNTPPKVIPARQGREEVNNDEFLESTLDLWRIPAQGVRRVGHPATCPVELPLRLIERYTYAGGGHDHPLPGSLSPGDLAR